MIIYQLKALYIWNIVPFMKYDVWSCVRVKCIVYRIIGFPYSALFLNVGLNGVSNLVLDNSLFILAILFFVVGMININEMYKV